MPLFQVRAVGRDSKRLSRLCLEIPYQPPQPGVLVAEPFTPSGARPWDLLEKSSLGWPCLPSPSEPCVCWKEASDAGPGKAKHNLRTGPEPSSPITLWQAVNEAAELPAEPPAEPPAPCSSQHPCSVCWADTMPMPGGLQESPLPFGGQNSQCWAAEQAVFGCCGLFTPPTASG